MKKLSDLIKFERMENYIDNINKKFNVPVLKVIPVYDAIRIPEFEGEEDDGHAGYMSLFRMYSIQISGTRSGNWSLGASIPRPFVSDPFFTKDTLKMHFYQCINSYLSNAYGNPGYSVAVIGPNMSIKDVTVSNYFDRKTKEFREYREEDFDEIIVLDLEDDPIINDFINDSWNSYCDYYDLDHLKTA